MVVFGYAIGLMVANFAVSYFEVVHSAAAIYLKATNIYYRSHATSSSSQTGQPALLYIVPLTLGPVLLRSVCGVQIDASMTSDPTATSFPS